MNEVIREFLIETHENLAQLDLDLVTLEKDPTERETLARAFRTLHTVKGTAGFLGLQKLQGVAHAAENLLSRLRDGVLIFNPEIATALLAVVDAVRQMLAKVEETETDGDGDFSSLIQTLERLKEAGVRQKSGTRSQESGARSPAAEVEGQAAEVSQSTKELEPVDSTRTPPPSMVIPGIEATTTVAPAPEIPVSASAGFGDQRAGAADTRAGSAVSDSTIRVDVGLLDKLMTLVGELVLARNQIMQSSAGREDTALLGTMQRLNRLTSELQAGVMKTRMQPISNIWSKFPRVVRDMALACGKQARLEMEGQDTELDKTIIEAIRDPLTHLIRNAVDHGIEPPPERLARGKAAEGRLALHAFHEGGKVIIEIADDGGGIDPQRIRAKAIQARLVRPEQAERLNDRELVNLIFLPGFSTADKVTQFSGRGVGMDVVRTHIEKIGGQVTIDSQLGQSTKVKMTIPLTLAIIPALTITSNGDRYAIPQVSLLELVRLEGEQAQPGIEWIHGAPVYRLRGNLLPLVYLNRELEEKAREIRGEGRGTRDEGNEPADTKDAAMSFLPSRLAPHASSLPSSDAVINIVVLQADDRQFGLIVDAIHDTEEIVVKPLQKQLKGISVFSGATIMGDGKVALILDVMGLAQKANVISGVRERALTEEPTIISEPSADRQTVLLFATREGGRMAIPLSLVARLEEFPRSAVERVGPQAVIQYRDEILPLIPVSRVLRQARRDSEEQERGASRAKRRPTSRSSSLASQAPEGESVQVVVLSSKVQHVGLVVERILDIAEETIVSRSPAQRPGVLFTAVIQDRVTEFLDVNCIARAIDPEFLEANEGSEVRGEGSGGNAQETVIGSHRG
jgi:two-component system chemotaxis sensor kinase CheA